MNVSPGVEATDAVTALGVKLNYGTTRVLNGIDLSLACGRTLALLGPSGCGKTTLLRLLAGLLAPTEGSIYIDGRVVADAAGNRLVPPERRGLGMVFQDYALWPHLTIAGNVSFPLEMRGIGRAERETRVAAALDRVGLSGFGSRNPSDLSGGQQQRVALARAIVAEPSLVLFDEPLSNLDRELRETMVGEIAQLVKNLGLTAVYVTHDHSEAFVLADEVAIMRSGDIVQLAPPEHLADQPATPEVAEFLKLGTVATIEQRDGAWYLPNSDVWLFDDGPAHISGGLARVLFSRAAVRVASDTGDITGTVLRSQFLGHDHAVTVRLGNKPGLPELQLLLPRRMQPGEIVGLEIEPALLRWFPAHS